MAGHAEDLEPRIPVVRLLARVDRSCSPSTVIIAVELADDRELVRQQIGASDPAAIEVGDWPIASRLGDSAVDPPDQAGPS